MSIFPALSAALTGLRATQVGLDVVANNIANAGADGFTRKTTNYVTNISGSQVSGVRVGGIQRELNAQLQTQLRNESAGASYSAVVADFLDRLQQLYGVPGSDTALDAVVNNFSSSIDALVTTPDSASARADVIGQAQLMAQTLNSLSEGVQSARGEADVALRNAVEDANDALATIEHISKQLVGGSVTGAATAALYDQRDAAIATLSSLMDIRVVDTGKSLSIFTTSGATLFDGQAAKLVFDDSGAVGPENLYNRDPALRTIGTVTLFSGPGPGVDLLAPGMLRSGSIHAYAELRDETLVSAQDELDELAANLAKALGTRPVAGVAASSGAANGFDLDVSDLAAGNEVHLSFTQNPPGVTRNVVMIRVDDPASLPLSNDLTADPGDVVIGVDFSGGLATATSSLQSAVDAMFGAGALSVSSPAAGTLRILDDGAAGTTDVNALSARVTATALSGDGLALPVFVDGGLGGAAYTGSVDGSPQKRGFAGRIAVNDDLISDPSLLVKYNAGTANGDNARPIFLRDALGQAGRIFTRDGTTFTGTIGDFSRQIIDRRARESETAGRVAEGQAMVITSLQERFAQTSGVNIDDEMSRLLQLQTAYAANARVVTAVKEMLDMLMNM